MCKTDYAKRPSVERERKKEEERIVSTVIYFLLLPKHIVTRQTHIFGSNLDKVWD